MQSIYPGSCDLLFDDRMVSNEGAHFVSHLPCTEASLLTVSVLAWSGDCRTSSLLRPTCPASVTQAATPNLSRWTRSGIEDKETHCSTRASLVKGCCPPNTSEIKFSQPPQHAELRSALCFAQNESIIGKKKNHRNGIVL